MGMTHLRSCGTRLQFVSVLLSWHLLRGTPTWTFSSAVSSLLGRDKLQWPASCLTLNKKLTLHPKAAFSASRNKPDAPPLLQCTCHTSPLSLIEGHDVWGCPIHEQRPGDVQTHGPLHGSWELVRKSTEHMWEQKRPG